jgi:transcription elongation factor GreB
MAREPQADEVNPRNNLITPRGYRRLMDELRELLMVERPRIVEEVRHAAKQGDRSENAEYQYGKKRLREIDRRVRFLNRRVELARIIEPSEQAKDQVRFGALVEVVDGDGRAKRVQIVGEDEVDLRAACISWKSPLARALMGAKRGDVVEVKAPKGDVDYEVIDFSYPAAHDDAASGDGHEGPGAS